MFMSGDLLFEIRDQPLLGGATLDSLIGFRLFRVKDGCTQFATVDTTRSRR
jgi:hypothetical protein